MRRISYIAVLAVAAAALGVTAHAQTNNAPEFSSAILDRTTGSLTISFDKNVDLAELDLTKLHIRDQDGGTGGVSLDLSSIVRGGDVSYPDSPSRVLTNDFNQPQGIAINGTDHVFVADTFNHRVQMFYPNMTHIKDIGIDGSSGNSNEQLNRPENVAVNATGYIFVADFNNKRVQIFDSNGTYADTIPVRDGSVVGFPNGVAFDSDGRIIVSADHSVSIFNPDGSFVDRIGESDGGENTANDGFQDTEDVAVDSNDRIIVPQNVAERVSIFTLDGEHVYTITKKGSDRDFDRPHGIVIDSRDRVIVADPDSDKVYILSYDGESVESISRSGSAPTDAALDSAGRLWVTDDNDRVDIFNPLSSDIHLVLDGDTLAGIGDNPVLDIGTGAVRTAGGDRIAASAGNTLIVLDDMAPEFDLAKLYNTTGEFSIYLDEYVDPFRTDPTKLHIRDAGQSSGGVTLSTVPVIHDDIYSFDSYIATSATHGTDKPSGIAVASDGDIIVADSANHCVRIFHSDGTNSTIGTCGTKGTANDKLEWPRGVAVDGNDNIFVADTNNCRVQVFDASGGYDGTIGKTGECGDGFNRFNNPRGVAIDDSGRIIVADTRDAHRIIVYDPGSRNDDFGDSIGKRETVPFAGSGRSEFDTPHGVATNGTHIFAADTNNHRIQILYPNGTYVDEIGKDDNGDPIAGSGDAEFRNPHGVAIDGAGRIIVADTNNHRVQVLGPDGSYVTEFGSRGTGDGNFTAPRGVAVDGTDILVVDTDNDRIQRFTPRTDGSTHIISDVTPRLIKTIGSFGTADGQFNQPSDIALHGNSIYVADSANHRVQILDFVGDYVDKVGKDGGGKGSGNGEFEFPRGIAVNGSGHIFVSDGDNNRIHVLEQDGTPVRNITTTVPGGSLNLPQGIAIDADNRIFVADRTNKAVQIFNSDGSYMDTIDGSSAGGFERPVGVAVGGGMIAVADTSKHRVSIFDSADFSHVNTFGGNGGGDEQFKSPHGVAIDGTGRIWVADTNNHRIKIHGPDGSYVAQFGSEGGGDVEFREPRGITIDEFGIAWVADTKNHRIQPFAFASDGLMFDLTSRALGIVNDMERPELDIDRTAIYDTTGLPIETSHNNKITTDTTPPVIGLVGTVPGSGTVGYNGTITVTLSASESGLSVHPSSTINNMPVENTLLYDPDTETYAITYIVSEDDGRVRDSQNITSNIILYDMARNPSNAITVLPADSAPGIDGTKAAVTLEHHSFDPRTGELVLNFSGPVNSITGVQELRITDPNGNTLASLSDNATLETDGVDSYGFSSRFASTVSFNNPAGIVFNGTDHAFIADSGNHRILVFDSDGLLLDSLGNTDNDGNPIKGTEAGHFEEPYGVAIDSTGRLIVSDSNNNRIQILYQNGAAIDGVDPIGNPDRTGGQGPHAFRDPRYLDVDSKDRIIVADLQPRDTPKRVQIFNSNGTHVASLNNTNIGPAMFDNTYGIAIDSRDRILVTDVSNHNLLIFYSNGTLAGTSGGLGPEPGKFNEPRDLDTDAMGRIFIADARNHRVQIFDPDGSALNVTIGSSGTGPGQFNIPDGVAFDSTGRLFVSERVGNRVQIFEPFLSDFVFQLGPAAAASMAESGSSLAFDMGNVRTSDGIHLAVSDRLKLTDPPRDPPPPPPPPEQDVKPLVRSSGGGGGGGGGSGGGGGGSAVSPVLVIYDVCGENPSARVIVSTHGLTTSARLNTLSSIYEGVQVNVDPGRYVTNVVDADVRIFDFELDSTDSYAPFSIVLSGGGGRGVSSPVSADQCSGYAPLSDVPGIELVRPVDSDLTHGGLLPAAPGPSGTADTDTAVSEFSYEGTMYAISHDPHIDIMHMDVNPDSKSITFTLAEPTSGMITLDLPDDLIRGMIMVTIQDEQLDTTFDGSTVQVTLPDDTTQFTLVASYVVPEFGVIALLILGASLALVASMRRYMPSSWP